MFDALTRDQLYDLHTSLFNTHTALHAKLVGPAPERLPLIDPLSGDWNVISAACEEVSETMTATLAEITRRSQDPANA
jgi:hypothetical protein